MGIWRVAPRVLAPVLLGLALRELAEAYQAADRGSDALEPAQEAVDLLSQGGDQADLVILSGNPLEDIRNTNTVRYVMKNRRLHDGDTLTEIHPTPRDLPPVWWHDPDPSGVPGMAPRGER